ncbi:type VII secretion protein EccB [Actinomadura xylanilytica]|uniref:type VII secretion protein EccB n=1 Tax=Actinomadura xylanilytica TaxID=887459 RepID=UPI00255B2E2C|nr:type VII secretion protein EccB [Actinomadura xylanilytica]MDL4772609.1 type VII secretion protein EccB [Actinomadura xylanilytica]
MQTRKDLYQAHRLMTQRVALALLQGRPGAAESPLRRTGVGALCGVMVAVLVAAGFGISGLLFKGGARNLEKPGVLIIEKETGASYAYSADSGKLTPFLNYTSARLAMSSTSIERKLVSAKSLAKYGRGPMTGIQGAPESLPDPNKPAKAPWSLCVRDSGAVNGSRVSLVGGRDVGGRPLGEGQGLVVHGGAQAWLIWHNTRMRISPKAARVLSLDQPVPVDERWLNGLPQGPDFAAPPIPKWSTRVPGPDGTPSPVGQTYRVAAVAGTGQRYYVLLADGGLSSISESQARLLLDEAGAGPNAPGQPREITPGVAASNPSKTNLHSRDLPETPPKIVPYTQTDPLCAVYRDTDRLSAEARFTIGGAVPPSTGGAAGLDEVSLPGGGTFAGTLSGPGQRPQTFSLITDQGLRYPVPTQDEVTKLGYSTSTAVPVPANLLQLFREGPALASAAALRPVPAT